MKYWIGLLLQSVRPFCLNLRILPKHNGGLLNQPRRSAPPAWPIRPETPPTNLPSQVK
jgi:hypothetical protein